MPKLPSTVSAALVVFCIAASALVGPVSAQTTPEEKQAIETIVRDYLLAHPEVIEEAITLLRQKREGDALAAQAKAVESSRDLIFNSEHQMVLGNPQGPITVVEFFDYNCGYCKRAVSDMTALIEANPDVRVVLKEFPILSEGSVEAARMSVAVKDSAPDSYLKFHEALFSRPGQVDGAKAMEIVRELGLDPDKLSAVANGEAVTRNLQEVQKLASTLGISGTPSYVIGTELVPGAAGFDTLQEKVEAMRECGATKC
jgi:protein-disulfide isomerase